MTYIVTRRIKGVPYLYEQESFRVNGKVHTRTVRYLGKKSNSTCTKQNDYMNKKIEAAKYFTNDEDINNYANAITKEQPVVVRAVVKKDNKVLIVKRGGGETVGRGFWQFPGGNLDGQRPIDALKRELKEEVNVIAKKVVGISTYFNPNTKRWTFTYNVKGTDNIKLQESELDDYKWVDRDTISNYPLTPNTIEILNTKNIF